MAKGRGKGERTKEPLFLLLLSPSYSLPRLFSSVLHFAPLSTIHYPLSTVRYAWNRLVHRGLESFFQCRCKGSIDVHLKAHTHTAAIPALALVKRHFFSIFRFAEEESSFVTKYRKIPKISSGAYI